MMRAAPNIIACVVALGTAAAALGRSWHVVSFLSGTAAGMQAVLGWREWHAAKAEPRR